MGLAGLQYLLLANDVQKLRAELASRSARRSQGEGSQDMSKSCLVVEECRGLGSINSPTASRPLSQTNQDLNSLSLCTLALTTLVTWPGFKCIYKTEDGILT